MKTKISFNLFKSLRVVFKYAMGLGAEQRLKKTSVLKPHFPIFDEQKCVGCKLCLNICPSQAIKVKTIITDNQIKPVFQADKHKCVVCGLCVQSCPQEALKLELVED